MPAIAATGSTGIAAAFGGRNYLLTLAPAGGATPGATKIAETGPVQVPRGASQVALRISSLTGAPGSQSAAHSHPGAEGYYIISGEFGARSRERHGACPGRTYVCRASRRHCRPGGKSRHHRSTSARPLRARCEPTRLLAGELRRSGRLRAHHCRCTWIARHRYPSRRCSPRRVHRASHFRRHLHSLPTPVGRCLRTDPFTKSVRTVAAST